MSIEAVAVSLAFVLAALAGLPLAGLPAADTALAGLYGLLAVATAAVLLDGGLYRAALGREYDRWTRPLVVGEGADGADEDAPTEIRWLSGAPARVAVPSVRLEGGAILLGCAA